MSKELKVQNNKIDEFVGDKLRRRRVALCLTQDELAYQVGLTFQQIQKYEKGSNRVSASKLFAFAKILRVTVSYFFDGIEDQNYDLNDIGIITHMRYDEKITKKIIANNLAATNDLNEDNQLGFLIENGSNKYVVPLCMSKDVDFLITSFCNIKSKEYRDGILALMRSVNK